MADDVRFVTRFAPSPTGLLHLGHAYSAGVVWRAAAQAGGRVLLRIEDIDRGRCRSEFEDAIYEDLSWLGFSWETPVRRQSEHFEEYEAALARLIELGVVYRCFKTRREVLDAIARAPHLAAQGPEGPRYVGGPLAPSAERRLLEAGAPYAWRLSMSAARRHLGDDFDQLSFVEEQEAGGEGTRVTARPEIFGDEVVARKDAGTSYHLASVHDDALLGVSHIIRGEDLRAAAHLHRLLQALLEYAVPIYRHHRLIADEAGRRFAKRDRSQTLRGLRESGVIPRDVLASLGLSS